MRTLVIGGGVVGATTAYYLAESGHEVTLVDRATSLAAEGSYANGAMLHAGHTEPWNSPQVIGQLLRWVGREDSPLLLRPAQIPRLLGWGIGFLRYSSKAHHMRSFRVNTRLAVYSQRLMNELSEHVHGGWDERRDGILEIFRDQASLDAVASASAAIEDLGVEHRVVDQDGVFALEPALAEAGQGIVGGVYFPRDVSGDARTFSWRLGELVEARGGTLRLGEAVQRIERDSEGVTGVVTERERLTADRYVLAAGVDAPLLARPLGVKLPIKPAKGYSATLPIGGCSGAPQLPLIDGERRVVITPLGDRLRMAGTAEFAGYDRSVRRARVDQVMRQSLASFPELARQVDTTQAEPWACLRPLTVDGPPVIGASPLPNLFLNTGAGHLGWTFAAGAGRIVADLVSGREPEIDLDGLTLERY